MTILKRFFTEMLQHVIPAAALLAAFLVASMAGAQVCAWDPDIASENGVSTEPPRIHDGSCVDVSPVSVIWLESTGCQCTVDVRILASWQSCNGAAASTCDNYAFSYSIACVASGSGQSLIGQSLSSATSGNNPPPVILYDEAMRVECGSVLLFDFTVGCTCEELDETLTIDIEVDPHGQVAQVHTYTTWINEVCSETSESLCRFSARCGECSPANPPPPIPIEH